jgi:hypothetical protein
MRHGKYQLGRATDDQHQHNGSAAHLAVPLQGHLQHIHAPVAKEQRPATTTVRYYSWTLRGAAKLGWFGARLLTCVGETEVGVPALVDWQCRQARPQRTLAPGTSC